MNVKILAAMGLVNHRVGQTIITYPDIDRWCNKLMRYLKISRKEADKIACSKLVYFATNYKYLVKYEATCINNPLEPIKSNEHAMNVYRAHIRQNDVLKVLDNDVEDLDKSLVTYIKNRLN